MSSFSVNENSRRGNVIISSLSADTEIESGMRAGGDRKPPYRRVPPRRPCHTTATRTSACTGTGMLHAASIFGESGCSWHRTCDPKALRTVICRKKLLVCTELRRLCRTPRLKHTRGYPIAGKMHPRFESSDANSLSPASRDTSSPTCH